MACQIGDVGFEGIGGGVFLEDVVEEGGVLDGGEHGGGGGCDDVACEGYGELGKESGMVGR